MITPSYIDKEKRYKQRCQRRLRTLFSTSTSINFSSTDYLNLSNHPYVKEQGIAYSIKWGSGCLSTRMLHSYDEALKKSEARFAEFLGTETVIFYESNPLLLASIPCIDNTLSFGILGPHGFGIGAQKEGINLISGGFSKSFGTYVSYLACSKETKSELFDRLPILHKEQYIPPLFLGMIDATIQLLPSMQAERKRYFALKTLLERTLQKAGFSTLPLSLHSHLLEHGVIPSVTKKDLTLFPNLSIEEKQILSLLPILSSYRSPSIVEAL